MNEREEMFQDREQGDAERQEAVDEAIRLLPQARSFFVVGVIPSGDPFIASNIGQTVDVFGIKELSALNIRILINRVNPGATQEM